MGDKNAGPQFHTLYAKGEKLGKGAGGTVYLCTHRSSRTKYAVKEIDLKPLKKYPSAIKKTFQEISFLRKIDHPNVIKLCDVFETPETLYIVMEYADGGDLQTAIYSRHARYNERTVQQLVKTITEALKFCKDEGGVVHRDVKPQNILLKKKIYPKNSIEHKKQERKVRLKDYTIKLGDFNLSHEVDPKKEFTTLETYVGTVLFMAPEIMQNKRYDYRVDVWSLGVVTYMLLSGGVNLPFAINREKLKDDLWKVDYKNDVLNSNWNFKPEESWEKISESAKDFLRKVLVRDPSKRLNYAQMLDHPWLKVEAQENVELSTVGKDSVKDDLITVLSSAKERIEGLMCYSGMNTSSVKKLLKD